MAAARSNRVERGLVGTPKLIRNTNTNRLLYVYFKAFTLRRLLEGVQLAVFTWKSVEHCLLVHCSLVHCSLKLRLELMNTEMKTGLAGLKR